MTMLMRLAAVYMILVGAAVAVHFVVNQFYDPLLEGTSLTVWQVLDPMMVAGLAIVILVGFVKKGRLDSDGPISRAYLEANFTFYFSTALMLALLWNWIGVEWSDPPNSEGLVWILIDSTLPLLFISTAIRLLRKAAD